MEFIIIGTDRANRTAAQSRELFHVFAHWQPPEGVNLKGILLSVDGRTGFVHAEADSAAAILELTAAYTDYLDFQIHPVLPAEEAAPIHDKMMAWVDQTKSH